MRQIGTASSPLVDFFRSSDLATRLMENEPGIFRRILNGGLEWLHTAFILSILVATIAFELRHDDDARVRFAYWFMALYLCILLLGFGYFVYTSGRKSRYAEATTCIHGAIHTIRDASWRLDQVIEHGTPIDEAHFRAAVQRTLDATAKAFSIVTGTNNRACIKVLGPSQHAPYVKTFARDSISAMQCAQADADEGDRHLIDRNTDFHLIIRNGDRYFFHNNLSGDRSYRNSSVEGADNCPKNYAATIVFPIRHALTAQDREVAPSAEHIAYLGFLAVDTKARKVYSERYDVELGAIVADALFPLFERWEMLKHASANTRSMSPHSS